MERSPETHPPIQEEVRNVARSLVNAVGLIRSNRFERPDEGLQSPRRK